MPASVLIRVGIGRVQAKITMYLLLQQTHVICYIHVYNSFHGNYYEKLHCTCLFFCDPELENL